MAFLVPWSHVSGQSRAQEPIDLLEFRLSRAADPVRDTRAFSQADILEMWVRDPAQRDSLSGQSPEEAIGWWLLYGPSQAFSGALILAPNGLVGSFPLDAVHEGGEVWSWSVAVERDGRTVASYSALLTIAGLAPRADFVTSVLEGELPLTVSFEDRSQGEVTSWAWDFGDGATSNEPNPTHVYTLPGTHSVTLSTANRWGDDTRVAADWIRVLGPEPEYAIQYGMNASENVWWQRGIAFADAMARAGEFFRVENGTIGRVTSPIIPQVEDLTLTGAGWPDLTALAPGEKVGARLFGSMAGSMPDGRESPYVLTWVGTGSCVLDGQGVVGEANRTANRVEVFVDPSAADGNALLTLIFDWSDPADPVRDVHVWLPGMEAEQPILWPPFVEKVRAMSGGLGPSTWRSMDWCKVNEYGRTVGGAPFVFDLAGRIRPGSPSQGTKRGVCPEFQVAFANAVDCDLHFNVPHNANGLSDQKYEFFLRDTFTRIRDGSPPVPGVNGGRPFAPLAPHLKLTVEFSNETWNSAFPVNAWLKSRALANGRTLEQQIAAEIRRVFAVAEEVFSGPHAPRLRRFVGGWVVDATFLQAVLEALGPDVHVDAAGPACYFRPRNPDVDAWMLGADTTSCPNCPTPEAVIESARARLGEVELRLLAHRLVLAQHVNPDGSHPRFELYESGASFEAGFQPWGRAASQAQRLPAMYDAYVLDFVPTLVRQGVEAVHWYSFMTDGGQGSAGPFGHWERMDQTITLPVPDVYVDEGLPKAAAIYKAPPLRTP